MAAMPVGEVLMIAFLVAVGLLALCGRYGRKRRSMFEGVFSPSVAGGAEAVARVLSLFHLFDARITKEEKSSANRSAWEWKTVVLSPSDHDSASFAALAGALRAAGKMLRFARGEGLYLAARFLRRGLQMTGTVSLFLVPLGWIVRFRPLYFLGLFLFAVYVGSTLWELSEEQRITRDILRKLSEERVFPREEISLIKNAMDADCLRETADLFQPLRGWRRAFGLPAGKTYVP
jgi:Zn-dependent membrane protease YugP